MPISQSPPSTIALGNLSVDRFAIHSLCYRVVDGQLRFAARADDLADASTQIDPQAIFDYLYFHVIPSPRTIYKDIYRLPPGHSAAMENGQVKVTANWVPKFDELRTRLLTRSRLNFANCCKMLWPPSSMAPSRPRF